jgi:hypothetical protein
LALQGVRPAGRRLGWARHVNDGGRVALLIEGDDGTQLTKKEISAALRHPEESDRKLKTKVQHHS